MGFLSKGLNLNFHIKNKKQMTQLLQEYDILNVVLFSGLLILAAYSKALYSERRKHKKELEILESYFFSHEKNEKQINDEEGFLKVQMLIDNTASEFKSKYSDGYHSYRELYEFRKMYNAAFFNELAKIEGNPYVVHKSMHHSDKELCFGGGWFIVIALLPHGMISNHYRLNEWDLFKIPDYEYPLIEFDGHTPADVLERMKLFLENPG